MVRAGSLTVDSSNKQARFMRFCDCFNIPIIFLVDTPAYQPGTQQERAGIIRHGAKVLYALCEATVPRISIILRKAYGGGNLGMAQIPGMGTDFMFHWPTTEVGVMGPEQSVELFFGPQIAAAPDPVAYKKQMVEMYKGAAGNPLMMASFSPYTEDVIEPKDTRRVLIKSLEFLRNKKVSRYPKRHGNIPL
jgi:acetyl-CoA carboxylase carboxyltransferase component